MSTFAMRIPDTPSEEARQRANANCLCAFFVEGQGPDFRPLFVEPRKSLSAWVAAIQAGQDLYPPWREIRASMANWRVHVDKLLDEIHAEKSLYLESFALELRQKTLQKDSPDLPSIQRQISELDEKENGLRRAQNQELDSHFSIPSPFTSTDRTGSSFDGPITPGNPDRLWIWLSKRSTIINHSIDAQIGLGNKNGANVVADRDYPLTINCNGCEFNNTNPVIKEGSEGSRVVHSSVTILSPKASLTTQSPNLRAAVSPAAACRISGIP